jgi:hypothetical protein
MVGDVERMRMVRQGQFEEWVKKPYTPQKERKYWFLVLVATNIELQVRRKQHQPTIQEKNGVGEVQKAKRSGLQAKKSQLQYIVKC